MSVPKLKDVAAATGVHEMTVSRALRNVGRMRPETRERVHEAARKLGYRPNAAAAAMRTGRTGCIAMISGTRLHASYLTPQAMATIIETVAIGGGYLAHACVPGDVDVADADKLPRLLSRRLAEGLLLNYTHDVPPHLEDFLRRNALPAVWLNHKRPINAVYPDDFGAARKVTEQLLSLGHKRIAFIRMLRESEMHLHAAQYSVADCVAGYDAAMRKAGLRPDVRVFSRHWDQWHEPVEKRIQPVARSFHDAATRPTAIITFRDGPILLSILQKLGLRVPEEISMVSFTCNEVHAVEQMLSWVPVPLDLMGRMAVEMLLQKIEAGQQEGVPSISLPYGEIASLHTVLAARRT